MAVTQECKVTGVSFVVSDQELELIQKLPELIPVLKGESLPLPSVHPFEFLRQMYVFGALRHLFKVKSVVSDRTTLTRYNPEIGTRVCTTEEFFSVVDNTEVGQSYNFSRSFFEQWYEVNRKSIYPPLNKSNCEDSEYVNGALNLKNCYLCFATWDSEDCMYCLGCLSCRDCMDLVYSHHCELCYSGNNLVRCYEVQESTDSTDCQSSFGLYGCTNCNYCFGCVGLDRAEYHIFNEKVSREQYEQFIRERNLSSFSSRDRAISECAAFARKLTYCASTISICERSTGAYIERCEDCEHVYNCNSSRFCGYLIQGRSSHYCYRGLVTDSSFTYQSHGFDTTGAYNCFTVRGGAQNFYSFFLFNNCSDCFGCSALNKKSYCILNKQYSKEEYFELVPRIIAHMKSTGEWGEWFPVKYAPHYYEEGSWAEYMEDIPKDVARARGYTLLPDISQKQTIVEHSHMPDTITAADIPTLTRKPQICVKTGKAFNFQKRELEYLLRLGIPLSRVHWNERMQERVNNRQLIPAV